MIDFEGILERNPIRTTVFNILGAYSKRTPRYDTYKCPFHSDKNPSFIVYDGTCRCLAGCEINGRGYGNVFDFVATYFNMKNTVEAANWLEAPDNRPLRVPPPIPTPAKQTPLSWDDIRRGSQPKFQPLVLEWAKDRGLRSETVKEHHLGRYPSWNNRVHWSDTETQTFQIPRFTIPDVAFGYVRNIECRRDDKEAHERLHMMDEQLYDRAAAHIGSHAEEDLISMLFGHRYTQVPNGIKKSLVKNVRRVVRQEMVDGLLSYVYPKMPYVLIHEGLLKALAVEDAPPDPDYMFPSVSCRGAEGISLATHAVQNIFIIQDNDWVAGKNGKEGFSPGKRIADRTAELMSNRNNVKILVPPIGFKAADDMIKDNMLIDWLAENGIDPIRRKNG